MSGNKNKIQVNINITAVRLVADTVPCGSGYSIPGSEVAKASLYSLLGVKPDYEYIHACQRVAAFTNTDQHTVEVWLETNGVHVSYLLDYASAYGRLPGDVQELIDGLNQNYVAAVFGTSQLEKLVADTEVLNG